MTEVHVHDDVCAATRVLADAGLLPPNRPTSKFTAACPCCGRPTAIHRFDEQPTPCTSCRMGEIEPAAMDALGVVPEIYLDFTASQPTTKDTTVDLNELLGDELKAAIAHDVANKPRTLQKALGPSEIGEECQRKLAYKLLDWDPKPNDRIDPLPSFVGTAAHEATAVALEHDNERRPGTWLVEKRVHASHYLSGSCDVYHVPTNTVLDHKFVGPASMKKYRTEGPRHIYRVQINLYALGWERSGYTPKTVAIAHYPRGGNIRDIYIWTAPYNRQLALDALDRLNIIKDAIVAIDPEQHPERWAMFPIAPSHACTFCEWWRPGSTDLSQGCPSDPDVVLPRASLEELIA